MAKCEVCRGDGSYPVITASGEELYSIRCPECLGTGDDFGAAEERDWKLEQEAKDHIQRQKYERVMAEKRAQEADRG